MNFINHASLLALGIGCILLCSSTSDLNGLSDSLSKKKCIPCSGLIPPIRGDELLEWKEKIDPRWEIAGEHHLEREFLFEDFAQALDFTNLIGALAEEEGHHPVLMLSYGSVKVLLWTHKVEGITESDFILAAKIDALL